ncbi:MAG: hypothetical protein IKN34_09890 [Treponema sp.]|nr:hypothetical protein [Treponema sp.]
MKKFCLLLCFVGSLVMSACKDEEEEVAAYEVSLSEIVAKSPVDYSYTPSGSTDAVELKKIVFSYPTENVAGERVTASASIMMRSSLYSSKDKAKFMVLVHHGAMTKNAEAPSVNESTDYLPLMVASADAIGVEADLIGFGASVNETQAFAYGDVNAKTSLHALICARKYLNSLGYTWEDKLANVGFSQGGQTAMHVQKVVDTDSFYASNVNVTKTFAGGGCYSINTTVDESIDAYNPPLMPAVIWLGLASYNALTGLGVSNEDIFVDTSILDELLDKQHDMSPNMKGNAWSVSLKSEMLTEKSEIRTKIRSKVAGFNCFFKPKSTSKILMFSDSNDDVVPTKNSDELFDYFNANGFTMTKIEDGDEISDFSKDNVYIRYSTGTYGRGCHMTANTVFMNTVANELATNW